MRWPCWAIVEFFRAVPVLLLMVFIFSPTASTPATSAALLGVVIALTLYNGAVLAEVFRAGVNWRCPGQAEAAYAIGMRKTQAMTIVLLPQAVKIMLPAIISQCVVALKDTSLGHVILAPGLTAVGKPIYLQFQNQVPTADRRRRHVHHGEPDPDLARDLGAEEFVGEKKPLEVPMVGHLDDGRAV